MSDSGTVQVGCVAQGRQSPIKRIPHSSQSCIPMQVPTPSQNRNTQSSSTPRDKNNVLPIQLSSRNQQPKSPATQHCKRNSQHNSPISADILLTAHSAKSGDQFQTLPRPSTSCHSNPYQGPTSQHISATRASQATRTNSKPVH